MIHTFAINGFGRIGRLSTRVWYEHHREEIELSAINTSGSMDLAGWAHLLKYDSTYGIFPGETRAVDEFIAGKNIIINKFPFGHASASYIIKEKSSTVHWQRIKI